MLRMAKKVQFYLGWIMRELFHNNIFHHRIKAKIIENKKEID